MRNTPDGRSEEELEGRGPPLCSGGVEHRPSYVSIASAAGVPLLECGGVSLSACTNGLVTVAGWADGDQLAFTTIVDDD